jgi:histone-lysine N-methyltransferase SETMAR
LVKDFLAKSNVTTLKHPPYSPDLTPADFYLFLRLRSAVKGRSFCDAKDIIKNATEELKRLSQYGFMKCFQHLYSRWQKQVVAQGDYFKGSVA